jgi:alpha-glucosidase
MPNTGHDVGGFAGLRPGPELFVRWIQNGIFHPRFTIHSWKIDGSANEPWMYPDVLPLLREAIQFRYRLLPYFYGLFAEAARSGAPILRPLVYEFPQDLHCSDESFDFMLGPSLLVASVLSPRVRRRQVYLPAGADWYEFYSGQAYMGGQKVMAKAPLAHIPLFVRAGSLIATGEVVHPLFHTHDDVRRVLVYPPRANGTVESDLYEDDGHSLNYKKGERTLLHLRMESSTEGIEIFPEMQEYGFTLPYQELEFILACEDSRPLRVNGAARQWQDDENRLHAVWLVPTRA